MFFFILKYKLHKSCENLFGGVERIKSTLEYQFALILAEMQKLNRHRFGALPA